MNPPRKVWISAAVVAAVVVGGISVAAAASAVRLDQAGEPAPTYAPGEAPGTVPGPAVPKEAESTRDPKDFVVRKDLGNDNPVEVFEHWKDRLDEAEPFPMPAVTVVPKKTGN
ncbi:hypothetical protein [Rhizohabitans arisaemae]|uniref:hypothetical protein n=1 Tax=Rhizohabitans arisaemae TaxID=2720610 RepID=UPI0024B26F09|nr:hypothetical protein [Rhizohabitans arisaemae]